MKTPCRPHTLDPYYSTLETCSSNTSPSVSHWHSIFTSYLEAYIPTPILHGCICHSVCSSHRTLWYSDGNWIHVLMCVYTVVQTLLGLKYGWHPDSGLRGDEISWYVVSHVIVRDVSSMKKYFCWNWDQYCGHAKAFKEEWRVTGEQSRWLIGVWVTLARLKISDSIMSYIHESLGTDITARQRNRLMINRCNYINASCTGIYWYRTQDNGNTSLMLTR